MKKRILLLTLAVAAVAVGVVGMSAFEAHVINVTAKIENALSVSPDEITFGTVFPQEYMEEEIRVALSDSFLNEGRVDDVKYFIRQKPKPRPEWVREIGVDQARHWCYDNWNTEVDPEEYARKCYYNLCPYLSKHSPDENDDDLPAFHRMGTDVYGYMARSAQDIEDLWTIDLAVPCFEGMCAQDWPEFVRKINPDADPYEFMLNPELQSEMFGCDLWIEVYDISETPPITTETGDGWGPSVDKEWVASGRWGNNQPEPGDFEMALKASGGATPWDQEGRTWPNNQSEAFSLVYDGSNVTLTIGSDVVAHSPLTANDKLAIYAKTAAEDEALGKVELTNMQLDGNDLPDLLAQGDASGRDLKHLLIDAGDISGGFTLTGDVLFAWDNAVHTSDEGPAFEVVAGYFSMP